jgi:UDP-N-acetylglucosamine 2-epimerase
MKKIVTIIGTRPQFVKAAPVSKALREHFQEILVNTGQHYDHKMAGVFFEELNIPYPDYDLNIGSGLHGAQTAQMLTKTEEVLIKESPDAVLVYGDTNSTLAGALAASKLHIPLIHIEAGLRSFNRVMPEEINRVLTDHVSNILFAPTDNAVSNLGTEGVTQNVFQIGDVMYDAVLQNLDIAKNKFSLNDFSLKEKEFILVTIHRAENTDDETRLNSIVDQLSNLKNETLVWPVHPRTLKMLKEFGLFEKVSTMSNLVLMEPISYLEMLLLELNAKFIFTDSGGVQKEAYFVRVPCVTFRPETEWIETVDTGWNKLFNPEIDDLEQVLRTFEPKPVMNLYGNGDASSKIALILKQHI